MKTIFKIFFFLFLFVLVGCGKKSYLEKYPGSDYPKQYPSQNEN